MPVPFQGEACGGRMVHLFQIGVAQAPEGAGIPAESFFHCVCHEWIILEEGEDVFVNFM